jgi:hypothetical protein
VPLDERGNHFIAGADSNLNCIREIKNAKINAGKLGSGTALTTSTLCRLMFNEPLSEAKTSFVSNEDPLAQAHHRQDAGRGRSHRRATRQAARRHEARGAAIHQVAKFDPNRVCFAWS